MNTSEPAEVEPTHPDLSDEKGALAPQAAAELAQELTLVAGALFAQMLPDTAANAVAGVSGFTGAASGGAEAAITPAEARPVGVPSVTPAGVPVPSAAPPSTDQPAAPLSVPLPEHAAAGIPVPAAAVPRDKPSAPQGIPVPVMSAENGAAEEVAPAAAPRKLGPRSLAMLEEISFLDE